MVTVYITAPPDHAADLAQTLVTERLAACVNRVNCQSTYRWEGDIHDENETILLAKTTPDRADALVGRVHEIHPYDVPCVERFEDEAAASFADWRADAVSPD